MIGFIIIILIIFTIYGYFRLKQRYQYWEIHRVPYLRPESLFFGNDYEFIVSGKLSMAEITAKQYNDLAPHRFGGTYHFYKPILYVRDPELIKNILIKDFHHFYDRSFDFANKDDPLSLHLFNLVGEEWKILRNKLSPTFTSGKMRILFELMKECAEKLNIIIDDNISEGRSLKVLDLMARYSIDVISSCAFGLETDSLRDANSIFHVMGKERFRPSLRERLRDAMFALCPKLVRLLRYQEIPRYVQDFFINLVSDTINYRKKNDVFRNDFLNLLMSLQDEKKEETKKFGTQIHFDVGILAAQCFVFFVAGFESTSNLLTFILYELAEHEDMQQKLQKEIDDVLEKYEGHITYDSLQEMHYMDKVMNESLRLFPPAPHVIRICTGDYLIPDSDYTVKRGQTVVIPTGAIQRDPQYFPNPEIFNPENFSEEAKDSRPNYVFLPFGAGPRNCIGMRFALMEIKLTLATIMKKYSVSISSQTELPIKLTPYIVLSTINSEISLYFDGRKNC